MNSSFALPVWLPVALEELSPGVMALLTVMCLDSGG